MSILPVVSKVFEGKVYNQFYRYLSDHGILYENQSGFRSLYSTDTALTSLTDNLKCNIDDGLFTDIILLDLQKAFDTVDHNILLSKLRAAGSEPGVIIWFDSYLLITNRLY